MLTTKIKMLLARYDMTAKELAEKIGMQQPTLSKKLTKGKFTVEEMEKIAKVFNAKYEVHFVLEDGEKI